MQDVSVKCLPGETSTLESTNLESYHGRNNDQCFTLKPLQVKYLSRWLSWIQLKCKRDGHQLQLTASSIFFWGVKHMLCKEMGFLPRVSIDVFEAHILKAL